MERLVKGDVLIVNYPFSQYVNYKKRPVLVVKVPKGEDIIVCQITGKPYENSVEIPIKIEDFQQGKLHVESYLRIDKILSIEKSLIEYKIGSLKQEKFDEILGKIIDYLKA